MSANRWGLAVDQGYGQESHFMEDAQREVGPCRRGSFAPFVWMLALPPSRMPTWPRRKLPHRMLMPEIPTVQNFSFQIHARKAIPKMKIKPMTRPKNGGELAIREVPKQQFRAVPIGCAESPFNPLFAPFGTTLWTFPRVNVQSTQRERFT